MSHLAISLALLMGGAGGLRAEALNVSPSAVIQLNRDVDFEQNLKYLASADTAITPARVLRWVNSLMGHSAAVQPSNFEFQPIVRVHDSQKQVLGQIALKF